MRSGAGDQSAKLIKKLHDNSLKLEQFYSNMFTGLKLCLAVCLAVSVVLLFNKCLSHNEESKVENYFLSNDLIHSDGFCLHYIYTYLR